MFSVVLFLVPLKPKEGFLSGFTERYVKTHGVFRKKFVVLKENMAVDSL